jgi:small subunit ribosomal protein S9
MADTSKPKIYSTAIGRRKSAIASVRLTAGAGEITVNGKPASQYFPGELSKQRYTRPFVITSVDKYGASVKVRGGGIFGQLDATVLGIARALVAHKETFKSALRDAGLMTRDPRERQRRMVGTGGKARRHKQSPKR